MMSPGSDWRQALRMFSRQPGLTASAVVAFGLGIGLTTLLFSIGYGIFLRGLPLPEGDRIAAVMLANVATGRERLSLSIHDYTDFGAAQSSFDGFAAYETLSMNVVVSEGHVERLAGARLTSNGFEVIHAKPLLGRVFTLADADPRAGAVVVLGYGPWSTRFGANPAIVGRLIRVDSQPATVIGVMPKGFAFPQSQEVWLPLRDDPASFRRGQGPAVIAYGRLKPGATMAQAGADLGTAATRLAAQYPDTNRNLVPRVKPYTDMMSGDQDSHVAMVLVLGTGFGVLLIACANVANLLFARAASRTREMAIRSALGAERRRIMRQMLIETLVLAAGGTAAGLALARAGIAFFNRSIVNSNPPFWVDVRLDGLAVAVTTGLGLIAALMAGLIPAWRASRADLGEVMKDGARSAGGLRIGRISRTLVTCEIALSFGLLVTAGLMVRSILNLGTHEYGFALDDVYTARVVLPETTYPDAASRARFARALHERLSAIPGARSATLATSFPGLGADRAVVNIEGRALADPSHAPAVRLAAIAPRFFQTFARDLVAGRDFRDSDAANAPPVAIANTSFVSRFLPGVDPVGQRVRLGRDPSAPWTTIVGVAPDLYMAGAENRDTAGLYLPLAQRGQSFLGLAVRGSGGPALAGAIRSQVSALDPDMAVYFEKTLRKAVDDSLWAYEVFGPLMVAVGAAALFLATVGLYSLMAFAIRQRLREIGLRIALGAQPVDLARLVASEVGLQVSLGLLAGAGFGALLSGTMKSMVFHVSPHDPATYAAIVVTLVLSAVSAAAVPVGRAIRVDPTVTLRDQ